jgi:hypothetical protein
MLWCDNDTVIMTQSNIPSGAVRKTWMRWRLILFHSANDEQNPQMTDTLPVMFL